MVMGKHSGRHAFTDRVKELGFDLSPDQVEMAFADFKDLALNYYAGVENNLEKRNNGLKA